MIPEFQPLFVSLPALDAQRLETEAGYLGWVLELIQQRNARPEEYAAQVRRVTEHLEKMPRGERDRWLQLLSYIRALLYHDREPSEQPGLGEQILASVQTDEHRREVRKMAQSMAEFLLEQGYKEGHEKGAVQAAAPAGDIASAAPGRFDKIPKATERAVTQTEDIAQLKAWLDRVGTASSLADVGIVRTSA